MNRDKLIKAVIQKLKEDIQKKLLSFLKILERNAKKDPQILIKYIKDFDGRFYLKKQERIIFLGKIQQKGIIETSLKYNPKSDRIWRELLKEWDLNGFKLERGKY